MKLVRPVPWINEFGPQYTRDRGDRNYDFAWAVADAQGMPNGPGGARVHGGTDMFGPGNYDLRSPVSGRIVRAETNLKVFGQVFGGVIAVESPEGHAVLFRHVNPTVPLGATVQAGDVIGRIVPWQDGWPHAHVELYRSWPSAYDFRNTIDPRTVEWVDEASEPEPVPDLYFEELPHDQGGLGPVVVWHGQGSPTAAAAIHKARGRIVSTIRDADGVSHVLWWLPGTYPNIPVFGPWLNDDTREAKVQAREKNTGRTMRPFRGRHRSLYPIAA